MKINAEQTINAKALLEELRATLKREQESRNLGNLPGEYEHFSYGYEEGIADAILLVEILIEESLEREI